MSRAVSLAIWLVVLPWLPSRAGGEGEPLVSLGARVRVKVTADVEYDGFAYRGEAGGSRHWLEGTVAGLEADTLRMVGRWGGLATAIPLSAIARIQVGRPWGETADPRWRDVQLPLTATLSADPPWQPADRAVSRRPPPGWTPGRIQLRPEGDVAQVTTRSRVKAAGQLLAVSDAAVYLTVGQGPLTRTVAVDPGDVHRIAIEGYGNRKWVTPLVLFEVVPVVLLGITATDYNDVGYGIRVAAVASIPTLLNWALFADSTRPSATFDGPLTAQQLQELRKYTRFPQGLTPGQLARVLGANQDTEVSRLR